MPRGSYVKSFLTTSVTAANQAVGTSAMNVPLMAAGIMPRGQAAGIQIWSFEFEMSDYTWLQDQGDAADVDKYLVVILSAVAVTAEKFVNDRDVLFKFKLAMSHEAGTVVGDCKAIINEVFDKDFYPAIPFYGQQLHLGICNETDASITVYCKVWYSLVTMTSNEVLAQLQNQLT